MARPKKIKDAAEENLPVPEPILDVVVPTLPPKLSVDYASEGLNNMARTINEVIDYLHAVQKW